MGRRKRKRKKRKSKAAAVAEPAPKEATKMKQDTTDGTEVSFAKNPKATSPPRPGGPVEIVFSFDTTVSMHRCLERVRSTVTETVRRVKREIPGIRIAIIGHGDYCDGPNTIKVMPFSDDENGLCEFVKNIPKTDGGDFPECYELVLNEVREKLSWTPGTQRSLVMIGDATPHPPTDPQNCRKLDWRVEAKKLHDDLGVHIYAVQALNESGSDSFYQTLARLTEGCHIRLDKVSTTDDFMIAVCLRKQSIDQPQTFDDEVHKRSPSMNRSTKKPFDELAGRESTHSGSRDTESKRRLKRRIAELEEQLRLQRKQIVEKERDLSHQQKEHASKRERKEQEWQDREKELKKQQDQLRYHTDLLQSNQHQQLSKALGLSEEQPSEVLEAYVTFEEGKVAASEKQALVFRHEQLAEYQLQARDLAGRLLNYQELLQRHMAALKERKEALEELESFGEKFTKELSECDQQLEKLREALVLAQTKLRSCKERFQEYEEKIGECLDEMNRCEGSLSQSLSDLKRCLDTLKLLRKKVTDELSNMDQTIQGGKQLAAILIETLLRSFNSQLEDKMAELQKCSKELEATESTLDRLKFTLQENEMELGNLRECIRKAKQPQPTSTISGSSTQLHQYKNSHQKPTEGGARSMHMPQSKEFTSHDIRNWEHQVMSTKFAAIITALADNSLANILADELRSRKLIGAAVHAEATNYGPRITEYWRVKQIITAMLSKIEHTPQRYHDFIDVLKSDRLCVDAEAALALLPSDPPVKD